MEKLACISLKVHSSYLKTVVLQGNHMFFSAKFYLIKVDTACAPEDYGCVLNLQPEPENEAECQVAQYNGIQSFSF